MRVRWMVFSLVVLATGSPRAFAQSASVQAESLFAEGRKLLQAGKLAEACAAFESSQKLDPAVTTLLNLADCREQNHQLATAWGTFVEAGRMARAKSDDKLARVASNHAHKLEPRLSKLTISVPADRKVPGLEVLRDNDPVNPASWNHALPIDGGTYTITARAPGRAPWSTTKTIKVEGDAQAVEIPKLMPGAPVAAASAGPVTPAARPTASPPVKPTPPPAAQPAAPPPPAVASNIKQADSAPASPAKPAGTSGAAASTGSQADSARASPAPAMSATPAAPAMETPTQAPLPVLPIAVGAGALVLGGAALGFDLWGNSAYDSAKQEMQDQARRDDLYHSANTRRYLAEGFGVAALGCAGAAVYLYVRSRGEGRTEATAMTPVASPQFTGLAVLGSW